jgi:hypothetical protein
VTKERVHEVYCLSHARPTHIHEEWREERHKYPKTINDQEGFKPMAG